jgi:uncharacterized protein (DUF1499 family)
MNVKTKKVLKWAGIVVAALVVFRVGVASIWPTINDVKTGATPEYADLQPQRFKQPYDRVFGAALAIAQAAGWEVTAQDPGKGEIRAVATTAVFRFKDDVTITIAREGEVALVNVRSHSRVGLGDFGTNARRIARFQAELATDVSRRPG